jgi:hypothetical protein
VPISLKRSYGPPIVAAAGALMLLGMFGLGRALDRDSLWKIVHDQCVPNETENASPTPCALVALQGGAERGYAVLKDRVGVTQYLLVPTARLTGIESAALLQPEAPNYFGIAWQERAYTERAAGRVNAATGAEIVVLRGHEGKVTFASFSSDGRRVVSASYDKTARLWHLPPHCQVLIDEARKELPHGPLPREREQYFLEGRPTGASVLSAISKWYAPVLPHAGDSCL